MLVRVFDSIFQSSSKVSLVQAMEQEALVVQPLIETLVSQIVDWLVDGVDVSNQGIHVVLIRSCVHDR